MNQITLILFLILFIFILGGLFFLMYKTLVIRHTNTLIKNKQNLKNHSLFSTNQILIELIQKIKEHYKKNSIKNDEIKNLEAKWKIIQKKEETVLNEVEKVKLKKQLIKKVDKRLSTLDKQSKIIVNEIEKKFSKILDNNENLEKLSLLNKNLGPLRKFFEKNIYLYEKDKEKIYSIFKKINLNIRKIRKDVQDLEKRSEILTFLTNHKKLIEKLIDILNFSPFFWLHINKYLPLYFEEVKKLYFQKKDILNLESFFAFEKIEIWFNEKKQDIVDAYKIEEFDLAQEEIITAIKTLEEIKENIYKEQNIKNFLEAHQEEFKKIIKNFIDVTKIQLEFAKPKYKDYFQEIINYFESLYLNYKLEKNKTFYRQLNDLKKVLKIIENGKKEIKNKMVTENLFVFKNKQADLEKQFFFLKEIVNNFIYQTTEKEVIFTNNELEQINLLKKNVRDVLNEKDQKNKIRKIIFFFKEIYKFQNIFNKYTHKVILDKIISQTSNYRNAQNKLHILIKNAENYKSTGHYEKGINVIYEQTTKGVK
ncbi:hypothetical protein [Mesomycoplasma neurolyticum]|uniref:Uncharacterized protein n=1 Tax=Mesomycoplasma neurolyticum TaxID=2120 RepID=A0A449A5S8_9BACT|nr:hypothetical protein [Mesomycoplasma neurolyticum]VEU59640.1 Uncharacterised protein [Mesomycoplasma neurolyticum]